MRDIIDAILYVLCSGCPWRMVPESFAARSTVYRWFIRLRDQSVFETINHHLLIRDRERVGREAGPPAAGLDSQSVKTTEPGGSRGGACPRARRRRDPGDAGNKVKGRKRHAFVDTDGRALVLQAHAASIQDRDGALPLSRPRVEPSPSSNAPSRTAPTQRTGCRTTRIAIEIVRKHPDQIGFAVHPRRRVVERFFARINRNRRLAKDFEASIASTEAFLYAASVMLLTRRLARSSS